MRILIISDTHGNYPLALKICDMAAPIDLLVHLGDGADDVDILSCIVESRISNVAGNCDMGSAAPREQLLECEGKKLLLVHGDAYGVKSGLGRLEERAITVGADIVLFGHTHRAEIVTRSGITFINPGTLMRESGYRSYSVLDITEEAFSARLFSAP